jgi:hypothetical protein
MMIDNKKERYTEDGYSIVTVWDFINAFPGRKHDDAAKAPKGQLNIATGYFTGSSNLTDAGLGLMIQVLL